MLFILLHSLVIPASYFQFYELGSPSFSAPPGHLNPWPPKSSHPTWNSLCIPKMKIDIRRTKLLIYWTFYCLCVYLLQKILRLFHAEKQLRRSYNILNICSLEPNQELKETFHSQRKLIKKTFPLPLRVRRTFLRGRNWYIILGVLFARLHISAQLYFRFSSFFFFFVRSPPACLCSRMMVRSNGFCEWQPEKITFLGH